MRCVVAVPVGVSDSDERVTGADSVSVGDAVPSDRVALAEGDAVPPRERSGEADSVSDGDGDATVRCGLTDLDVLGVAVPRDRERLLLPESVGVALMRDRCPEGDSVSEGDTVPRVCPTVPESVSDSDDLVFVPKKRSARW